MQEDASRSDAVASISRLEIPQKENSSQMWKFPSRNHQQKRMREAKAAAEAGVAIRRRNAPQRYSRKTAGARTAIPPYSSAVVPAERHPDSAHA